MARTFRVRWRAASDAHGIISCFSPGPAAVAVSSSPPRWRIQCSGACWNRPGTPPGALYCQDRLARLKRNAGWQRYGGSSTTGLNRWLGNGTACAAMGNPLARVGLVVKTRLGGHGKGDGLLVGRGGALRICGTPAAGNRTSTTASLLYPGRGAVIAANGRLRKRLDRKWVAERTPNPTDARGVVHGRCCIRTAKAAFGRCPRAWASFTSRRIMFRNRSRWRTDYRATIPPAAWRIRKAIFGSGWDAAGWPGCGKSILKRSGCRPECRPTPQYPCARTAIMRSGFQNVWRRVESLAKRQPDQFSHFHR